MGRFKCGKRQLNVVTRLVYTFPSAARMEASGHLGIPEGSNEGAREPVKQQPTGPVARAALAGGGMDDVR